MVDRAISALPSRDFAKTARFFMALGFERIGEGEEWLRLQCDAMEISFWATERDWTGPELSLVDRLCIFRVADVDGWHERLSGARIRWKMAGAPSLTSIGDAAWGVPAFCFTDPDRNLFWVVSE